MFGIGPVWNRRPLEVVGYDFRLVVTYSNVLKSYAIFV